MSSNEPGDAVRVVNAVLTSLDALKRRPNVLVLCTSNMQDAIDPAFRDRVDLQIYLGPPSLQARYAILKSCLEELSQKQIISPPCTLAELPSEVQLGDRGVGSGGGASQGGGGGARVCDGNGKLNPLDQWARDAITGSDEVDGSGSGMDLETAPRGVTFSGGCEPSLLRACGRHEAKLLDIAHSCDGYSGRSLRKLPLKAHAMYLQRKRVSMEQYLNAMATTIAHQK
jgi:SpoVK/Ycf46/Vps4 family AAA+-type ATPase